MPSAIGLGENRSTALLFTGFSINLSSLPLPWKKRCKPSFSSGSLAFLQRSA